MSSFPSSTTGFPSASEPLDDAIRADLGVETLKHHDRALGCDIERRIARVTASTGWQIVKERLAELGLPAPPATFGELRAMAYEEATR